MPTDPQFQHFMEQESRRFHVEPADLRARQGCALLMLASALCWLLVILAVVTAL